VKIRMATARKRAYRAGAFRRNSRGAVQIEFILSILTIIFLIFGMWELIMIVHTMNVLSDAAKEGVRYAIVRGDDFPPGYQSGPGNTSAIEGKVKEYAALTLHDVSAISVSVTYPDGSNTPPNRVRVVVAYTFVPYTALNIRPTLRAAAEGRIVF
jgi:hypothetical protein